MALGIRLISQDGEIQRSRLADDRRAALSEASRHAIAELEDNVEAADWAMTEAERDEIRAVASS